MSNFVQELINKFYMRIKLNFLIRIKEREEKIKSYLQKKNGSV